MNTNLFQAPVTKNAAGGTAVKLSHEEALAQIAVTGTFNNTFYSTGKLQLDKLTAALDNVDPMYAAQTAVYARTEGHMKDSPAVILAYLASKKTEQHQLAFKAAAPKVLENGKMVRNFVAAIRAGTFGRKSLGSVPKKAVNNWLEKVDDRVLFRASVGNNPSLADVIKLAHPKPSSATREAMYGYLIGKDVDLSKCPQAVQDYENWKKGNYKGVPDVEFRMLTSGTLSADDWKQIALNSSWDMIRQNLNTFERNGLFKDADFTKKIAARLADKNEVQKAKAFPYQLFITYLNIEGMPTEIKDALSEAVDIACENIPELDCKVVIGVDVSGSMGGHLYNGSFASKTKYVDIAAMFSAAIATKCSDVHVLPFNGRVVHEYDNKTIPTGKRKVFNFASTLAGHLGGGTDCSAPIAYAQTKIPDVDLMVIVSDNESWMSNYGRKSSSMLAWENYASTYGGRLINIDLAADNTSIVGNNGINTYNVGGFGDSVFDFISDVVEDRSKSIVDNIKKVVL